MAHLSNSEEASGQSVSKSIPESSAFIAPGSLSVAKFADGTPVKFGKIRVISKSRRGQRFNGKHND